MNYVQTCQEFVDRLSELDPDDELSSKDKKFFMENHLMILPLMEVYDWDESFLSRLKALIGKT